MSLIFKRLFDIIVASFSILLFAPLLVVICILVGIDSSGPVIYRGIRSGRDGRHFHIYKFRTMVPDAELLGGGTTAFKDPRITHIGRILRGYKLDELPQLFNVLNGEMSIVGPRPELPHYTAQYVGEERLILTVKPGITDYSSIMFSSLDEHVGATNADEVFEDKILPIKNQLRIRYAKESSFWVDLQIIYKTVAVLLKKIGC